MSSRARPVHARRLFVTVAVMLTLTACGGGDSVAPSPTTRPAQSTDTLVSTPTFEPGHEPLPIVDVEQIAAETGCPMTPYTTARILSNGESDIWYEADGLRVAPYAWRGRWYAGATPLSWRDHEGGPLSVTATRRDNGEEVQQRDILFSTRPLFNRLTLPESGCWDISATLGERTLTFTVYAYPIRERPDIATYLKERESLIPFPVPDDCNVSPLLGPEDDQSAHNHLAWRVDGSGLRLEGELDLLFEGDNTLRWYPDIWGEFAFEATLLSDPSMEAIIDAGMRRADRSGEHRLTLVYFPAPGCWQIRGSIDDQVVEATLYVYPATCRPEPGHAPPPCDPP